MGSRSVDFLLIVEKHVYYLGNPTLGSIDTSGASSVKRK